MHTQVEIESFLCVVYIVSGGASAMGYRVFAAVLAVLGATTCRGGSPAEAERPAAKRPAPVAQPRKDVMHRHNVVAAALSGDGERLATGSAGGEVVVWTTRPLVPVRDLPPAAPRGKISALALSADGSEALIAPDWKPAIERWDVTAGAPRGELAAHTGRTTAIAYAPAGGLIATGGADRARPAATPAGGDDDAPPPLAAPTVRLWKAGARVRELSGLTQRIGAIAFNHDGSLVAAGGEDTVKLWRTADGVELASYALHGEAATVAFRGDALCAASSEAAACFARPGTAAVIAGARAPTRAAAFTAGWLATGTFDAVEVRDATGAVRTTVAGRAYAIVGRGDELWAILADQAIAVRAGVAAAPITIKIPAS